MEIIFYIFKELEIGLREWESLKRPICLWSGWRIFRHSSLKRHQAMTNMSKKEWVQIRSINSMSLPRTKFTSLPSARISNTSKEKSGLGTSIRQSRKTILLMCFCLRIRSSSLLPITLEIYIFVSLKNWKHLIMRMKQKIKGILVAHMGKSQFMYSKDTLEEWLHSSRSKVRRHLSSPHH